MGGCQFSRKKCYITLEWPLDVLFLSGGFFFVVYCHGVRQGDKANDCNAKDGNPFGPFWDTFNIDFVSSEFYGPIGVGFNTMNKYTADVWNEE